MQALLADILPWIAVFYWFDGLAEIRGGQFYLSSAWGGGFRLLRPGLRHLGLAPAAEAIAVMNLPWLATRDALLAFDPKRRFDLVTIREGDVSCLPWAAVDPEAVGKQVRSRGRTLVVAAQPYLAAQLAGALRSLKAGLGTASEPEAAASGLAEIRARQRWLRRGLRAVATLLFLWTFGLGALVAYGGLTLPPGTGVELLALLLLLELALAVAYARAGGASRAEAVSQASWLVLWPVAALHPLLHLSLRQAGSRPALEAAAAVLPAEASRELAATEFGRAKASLELADGVLAEALARRVQVIVASAKRAGMEERDLSRPPERDARDGSWCPACRACFVPGTTRCTDCDVPLRAFG
ncbi:hypothetical protein [Anaeromyxobacter sp. PSR-1]|uniref:hypothetical protein n=1 Tax=unclassified Anaeromyxobacter TaxID=2620896 RepID=UPI0005E2B942|nr:hypothetical protein [Anaeromyxobacter sp. PSR-1]GAO02428.1 hypothetical protein PSR1_01300 [Anaeromyxobacter sp. PSR-1]